MPISTGRVITLPKSNYSSCDPHDYPSCIPSTGRDYNFNIGRYWTGNQRRKRRRFNAPTDCSSTRHNPGMSTIHQGICGCATVPAMFAQGGKVTSIGESSSYSPKVRSLQSKALARFSSNAGLGVTIAESAGTIRSLNDRMHGVVRILNALRKKDVKGALSVLHQFTGYNTTRAEARLRANPGRNYKDRVANFWLETAFGWTPLLQSIYDTMEVLGKDYRTDRRSRASDSHNGIRVGVVAEFRTSDSNRFAKLGILNPAEILWDLVPFSFVLDWFLPIGNSLRFLGARSLTTTIYMWTSREWSTKIVTDSFLGSPEGVLMRETTSYSRIISRPSVSTFTARLPATMWHAVTSAALIQSLRPR